ncbi:unnamed protein product [Phytophthora fragariaefolia]|uniref:Unnamed protein product n=1 Tax=Phytophthora fragariaefolia TaxID=1490495 RepID=A0A9W6YAS6_9STRA|nr:unnamed protein product [Phytophthora fragariaefolia]
MISSSDGDGGEDVDVEGIAGGTAAYMAPELLSSSVIANKKTDVYSFGILMNEVLHEEEPYQQNLRQFVGKGPFAAVLFAKEGNRPQIRDKKVTPELRWIIERCWSHRPCDRPTFDKIAKLGVPVEVVSESEPVYPTTKHWEPSKLELELDAKTESNLLLHNLQLPAPDYKAV